MRGALSIVLPFTAVGLWWGSIFQTGYYNDSKKLLGYKDQKYLYRALVLFGLGALLLLLSYFLN